jgi:hypothetical protein
MRAPAAPRTRIRRSEGSAMGNNGGDRIARHPVTIDALRAPRQL